MCKKATSTLLRGLLLLNLVLMPMLPVFASNGPSAGDHAMHAQPVAPDSGSPLSDNHVHCTGHCCFDCGMAFVETDVARIDDEYAPAILAPTVVHLYSHPLIAVPDRPPRTLS